VIVTPAGMNIYPEDLEARYEVRTKFGIAPSWDWSAAAMPNRARC